MAQLTEAAVYSNCISVEVLNSTKEYPCYDTKQSDGKDRVMQELWEMRSTPFIAIASTSTRSDCTW